MRREDLTPSEQLLWDAFVQGTAVELGGPDPTQLDAEISSWNADQRVRAEVITALARGVRQAADGYTAAIRLSGAAVVGDIDLADARVTVPIALERCWIERPVNLDAARTRSLRMNGCRLPSLSAYGAVVNGPLEFIGTHATTLYLADAEIKGTLSLAGAQLHNEDDYALHCGSMRVSADFHCGAREHDGTLTPFRCEGGMSMVGAVVNCSLYADGAQLVGGVSADGSRWPALNAGHLSIGQSLYAQSFFATGGESVMFRTEGEVSLVGAAITGSLMLDSAYLSNPDGLALDLSIASVGGKVSCEPMLVRVSCTTPDSPLSAEVRSSGRACAPGQACAGHSVAAPFRANGQIRLFDSHVTGSLVMDGARLESGPNEGAVAGERLRVDGVVQLRSVRLTDDLDISECRVQGGISLYNCVIGSLDLAGASLEAPQAEGRRICLNASETKIHQSVLANMLESMPFRAEGELLMAGISVGGSIDLGGAELSNPDGLCLLAERATIEGDVYLTAAFGTDPETPRALRSTGQFSLSGATVKGTLSMAGAIFDNPGYIAFNGEGLTVGRDLRCPDASLVLAGTKDEPQASLRVRGAFVLTRARVHGDVDLSGASLDGTGLTPSRSALQAENLRTDGDLLLGSLIFADPDLLAIDQPDEAAAYPERPARAGTDPAVVFQSTNGISLYSASVAGSLRFDGARLTGGTSVLAVDAGNLTVGGELTCRVVSGPRTTLRPYINGTMYLAGAVITKNMDLSGAFLAVDADVPTAGEPPTPSEQEVDETGSSDAATDTQPIELRGAKPARALVADRLEVGGDAILTAWIGGTDVEPLSAPFTAIGGVSIDGASVGGDLRLSGAELVNPAGETLSGLNLSVARNMQCNAIELTPVVTQQITEPRDTEEVDGYSSVEPRLLRFVSDGAVFMHGATIGGNLSLDGATLSNSSGLWPAFAADGLVVKRTLFARRASFLVDQPADKTAKKYVGGAFRVLSATLHSGAELDGTTFASAYGAAFVANNMTVYDDLSCGTAETADGAQRFTCIGRLSLVGATIRGNLLLRGAELSSATYPAFAADNLSLAHNLICQPDYERFTVRGGISLVAATIDGDALFDGAELHGITPDEGPIICALDATNTKVTGQLSLSSWAEERFESTGPLYLNGVTVQKDLDLRGASLTFRGVTELDDENTLDADGAVIAGNVLCGKDVDSRPFSCAGPLRLASAKISGRLDLIDVRLGRPGARPTRGTALLDASRLDARIVHISFDGSVRGHVDLTGARVGDLTYRPSRTQVPMVLDGMTYDRLNPTLPPKHRLGWLDDPGERYAAQPFEQLAQVYRGLGHDRDARQVLLHKHRRLRRRQWRSIRMWPVQVLRLVQDALTGYGYAPGRALAWLVIAFLAGWAFFHQYPPSATAQGRQPVYRDWLFALDSLLPTSPFGQQDLWRPDGTGFWVWIALQVLGWALVLSVVPAVTRALSRA